MEKLSREDLELMKKRLYEFGIFPAKTVNTALSLYSELDELKKALNIYDTNLILEVKEVNRVKDELEEIKARVREVREKWEKDKKEYDRVVKEGCINSEVCDAKLASDILGDVLRDLTAILGKEQPAEGEGEDGNIKI